MRNSLFITGGSGFIGRHLLKAIQRKGFNEIYCLSRRERSSSSSNQVQFVKGDLIRSESYRPFLEKSDVVIHLAAITGKTSREDYFQVNSKGTEILLNESKRAGVKNFLFVSSIAAKFKNKAKYYYAQSKEQAEDLVKESGLNYCIVRPTIVLGKDSPLLDNFRKLAKPPLPFVFGNGKVKIQPIAVEDLVDCFVTIIEQNRFGNEILELGGPEKLTIEELIQNIHQTCYQQVPRLLHVPLKPIIAILSILETFAYSLLPINVGQLASFFNDGTIEMNELIQERSAQMKDIDSILKTALSNGRN